MIISVHCTAYRNRELPSSTKTKTKTKTISKKTGMLLQQQYVQLPVEEYSQTRPLAKECALYYNLLSSKEVRNNQ